MSEKFYEKYIEKKNRVEARNLGEHQESAGGRGEEVRGGKTRVGAAGAAGGRGEEARGGKTRAGAAGAAGGRGEEVRGGKTRAGAAGTAGGRGEETRGGKTRAGAAGAAGGRGGEVLGGKTRAGADGKSGGKAKSFDEKRSYRAEKYSGLFEAASKNEVLENFDDVVQGVRPLNSKQVQQLPEKIRALSHQLTDERSTRRLGYMNDSVQLSAYVRYYTWWNLVRLTRLFANLPAEAFPDVGGADGTDGAGGTGGAGGRGERVVGKQATGDANETALPKDAPVCLDLGSGPLTVVIALWLARPELRKMPLTWYCLDISANSMALGEDIFLSVVARTGGEPWKIIRVKGSFGTSIKQKADFITCANMFNELDQSSDMPPEFKVKKYYDQLRAYSTAYAKFLIIEPGVPKAARTISLLRERFIRDQLQIVAPCPHAGECPMNGFKAYTGSQHKWCNFAFNTDDAPARLQKLSSLAKLPKERATLSFISANGEGVASSAEKENSTALLCRVASDKFRMPGNKCGVYACSRLGLVLLQQADEVAPSSGDLLSVKIKEPDFLPCDKKSGALLIDC